MGVKHKVCSNIAKLGGTPSPVVRNGTVQIRKKLLDFLFGQQVSILVLSPGDSVQIVEIHELKGGESVTNANLINKLLGETYPSYTIGQEVCNERIYAKKGNCGG